MLKCSFAGHDVSLATSARPGTGPGPGGALPGLLETEPGAAALSGIWLSSCSHQKSNRAQNTANKLSVFVFFLGFLYIHFFLGGGGMANLVPRTYSHTF